MIKVNPSSGRMSYKPVRSIFVYAFAVSIVCQTASAEKLSFNRDIRPLLSAACFRCHGFDEATRQADLRLDTPEGAKQLFASTNIDENPLWHRISSSDPDTVMPPPDEVRQLTADEKALLKRWIEEGGEYEQHWAFNPIAKTELPPTIDGFSHWHASPIDRFLLPAMIKRELTPQSEADRETLIRRVSFTLTGLPPTLEQIDAFVLDASEDAYRQMVDRFLNSSHYGEEMAKHWLDVARYGDTHGLHLDNVRNIWPYRDWVISSFNQNQPFDQFTIEQLAGDQIENPSQSQLVATGFNRCNVTTSEGGAIVDEFLYRYAVERASTTFQAWMGLTGGCAVCHDHKYDPISAKEFYSFYAFFYSAADPAMDGNRSDTPPYLLLPTPAQKARLTDLKTVESAAAAELDQKALAWASSWDKWIAKSTPMTKQNTEMPSDSEPSAENGADSNAPADPIYDIWLDDQMPMGSSQNNTSRNAEQWVSPDDMLPPLGRRALRMSYGNFHEQTVTGGLVPRVIPHAAELEVWVKLDPLHPPEAILVELNTAHGDKKGKYRFAWGEVDSLKRGKFDNKTNVRVGDLPSTGGWERLVVKYDSFDIPPGSVVDSFVLAQFGGVLLWDALAIRGSRPADGDPLLSFENWIAYCIGRDIPTVDSKVASALKQPRDDGETLNEELLTQARKAFIKHVARSVPPELSRSRAQWDQASVEVRVLEAAIPGTMIYGELATPRQAHVMTRGQYDAPAEPVQPGTPESLPPLQNLTNGQRLTRLDLAKWLVRIDHPLTARVTVNRFWQQVFGTGIVETADDFGTQGSPPTHPELLDWLAADFIESGWDVKSLMRSMVMSAAFRQASHCDELRLSQDPANRFLSRGPRIRLDAEQIRDASLATSGLINLRIGGEGFWGYQPPGIWEPVGYANSNTRYYLRDSGDTIYRRSLYSFIKRTAPPPFMSNFDAPNRELFCTRRERSNTPLQALQLMNDVQHVEAARSLAQQTLRLGGAEPGSRIDRMFRTVTARYPDETERRELLSVLDNFVQRFAADEDSARALVSMGQSEPAKTIDTRQLAAYTLLANLILNLDESISRN